MAKKQTKKLKNKVNHPPKKISFWTPTTLFVTCFGVGRIPYAPGTWGSLVGAIFFLLTSNYIVALMALMLPVFLIAVYASQVHMDRYNRPEDPQEIVIDEFLGQILTIIISLAMANIIFAAPAGDVPIQVTFLDTADDPFESTLLITILSFVLFRIFDIFKPWPICWFDENIGGGKGTMIDDMIAGLFAGLASGLIFLLI